MTWSLRQAVPSILKQTGPSRETQRLLMFVFGITTRTARQCSACGFFQLGDLVLTKATLTKWRSDSKTFLQRNRI